MDKEPITVIGLKNLKSELEDLKNNVILNEDFTKLYRAFCPGPITFILKKKKKSKISKIKYILEFSIFLEKCHLVVALFL